MVQRAMVLTLTHFNTDKTVGVGGGTPLIENTKGGNIQARSRQKNSFFLLFNESHKFY